MVFTWEGKWWKCRNGFSGSNGRYHSSRKKHDELDSVNSNKAPRNGGEGEVSNNIENKNNNIVKNVNIKKYNQSLELPVVLNVNPRSIYNKNIEFGDFLEINSVDLVCMSESWERQNHSVEELLKLDNYDIVSNVLNWKRG